MLVLMLVTGSGEEPWGTWSDGAGQDDVAPEGRVAAPAGLARAVIESWYCRIIDSFGLKGTLKGHLVKLPCHGQGHLSLDQVSQSSIQPFLEHF